MNNYEQISRGLVYAIYDEYIIDQGNLKEDSTAFFNWLENEGWILADKTIKNEKIDDAKFAWLATCVCIWRADKCIWRDDQGDSFSDDDKQYLEYGRKLQKEGLILLRKGYLSKELTDQDWLKLHEYRVFLACCILQKGSAWAYETTVELYEFGKDAILPPLGLNMPNLTLPYADDFYKSKNYTDTPIRDYFEILTPKALDELKMMFDAYESKIDETGREYAVAKSYKLPNSIKSWNLKDSIKINKKPVLLVLASSMDCFWARAGAVFEHLYRTYKDVIDIKWIEVDVWDWLIRGDTTYNHFKPHSGLEEPGHPISYEDRARMAKKLYMTHPHCSFPVLLDDMGDTIANYFHCSGGSGFSALIDIEGELAWTSKSKGWGELFNTRPPQRGCCDQFPWVNNVEQGILEILKNNGYADHKMFQKKPPIGKSFNEKNEGEMYLISSRVKSIDKANRILHIIGRPSVFTVIGHSPEQKMYFNDPHKMTIHVPKNTKIYCRNVPVDFEFLSEEDTIQGPGFKLIDTLTWEATILNVGKENCDIETIPELFKGTTYLFGKVISINSKEITIKPNMKGGYGENFIKNADKNLDLQAKAKDNWNAHKKWIDRGDKPVALSLIKDTLVYKQGVLSESKNCELNDNICVWYDNKDAGKDTINAAIILSSTHK